MVEIMEIILKSNTTNAETIKHYQGMVKLEYSHSYLNNDGYAVLVFKDKPKTKKDLDYFIGD